MNFLILKTQPDIFYACLTGTGNYMPNLDSDRKSRFSVAKIIWNRIGTYFVWNRKEVYVLSYQLILGYGQLLVLDESLSVLLNVS